MDHMLPNKTIYPILSSRPRFTLPSGKFHMDPLKKNSNATCSKSNVSYAILSSRKKILCSTCTSCLNYRHHSPMTTFMSQSASLTDLLPSISLSPHYCHQHLNFDSIVNSHHVFLRLKTHNLSPLKTVRQSIFTALFSPSFSSLSQQPHCQDEISKRRSPYIL